MNTMLIDNFKWALYINALFWTITLFCIYGIPWLYKTLIKVPIRRSKEKHKVIYWQRRPIEACNTHPNDLDIIRCDNESPPHWEGITWHCNKPKGHKGRHRAYNMISWHDGEFMESEKLEVQK